MITRIARRSWLLALSIVLALPVEAAAGMPSIGLSEMARLRIETISFFLAVFLGCSAIVRAIWNKLAKGPAPSHYSGNVLVLGGDSARKLNEMTDGTANTFLAGEVAGNFKPWGHPASGRDPALGLNRSPEGFGSPFPGGANFLFVDGSVRFIKNTIAPAVFQGLATPNGGEVIPPDSY